jgi:hypothetical protein
MTNAQLGWLVALCAKGLASMLVNCTLVVLSGGSDKESMARAHAVLDELGDLEDLMCGRREDERYGE